LAWLEIDLDAIAWNLGVVRDLAGPGVAVLPVVKADAYGHGAVPVARVLEAAGADGLCVATWDEALELRRGRVRAPILVLYPVPPAHVAEAARRRIVLTAGDAAGLAALLDACGPPKARGRRLGVALEVETGLGRGGLLEAEVASAVRAISATRGVRLDSVWSHLAAAGDAVRSTAQVERFGSATDELVRTGSRLGRRHLAGSGGLLGGSAPSFDAVRPGLAIYGLTPEDVASDVAATRKAARLRPAMSLRARPVRVVDLPAGHGVSYGPRFETARRSAIATLPLGYGDGWPRSLGGVASALVRGRRVPLVGTVAMDAIMADVTGVPGEPVTCDDEFTLLGDDGDGRIDVAELAQLRTTISWEVVTDMARRLSRVYHAAAGPIGVRTLISGDDVWPASSSGTGTSVTSRSTRS
jgi:alanine racemase